MTRIRPVIHETPQDQTRWMVFNLLFLISLLLAFWVMSEIIIPPTTPHHAQTEHPESPMP